MRQLQTGVQGMLASPQWEQRLGGFRAARFLINDSPQAAPFCESMVQACQDLLEDREVRVRWAVGEVLHTLCEHLGVSVWELTQDRILDSIRTNFDRDDAEPSSRAPWHGP